MPFRRVPAPPDLERVAQVLGGGRASGWVPSRPASGAFEDPPHGDGAVRGTRSRRRGEDVRDPAGAATSEEPENLDAELERLDIDLRRARRPGLLTAPEPLRLGRWSVSSPAVVSLLALVVALGCAFAIRILWAERAADTTSLARGGASVAAGTPTGRISAGDARGGAAADGSAVVVGPSGPAGSSGPTGASTGPAGPGADVVVHVVGQVVRPGLVRLRPGARVADAIAAAGGARSGADLSALNLARLVVDGEQVRVPRPGEVLPSPGGGAGPAGGTAGGASGSGGGLVDLNTADLAALDTLPGVGPVLAQRILDWRTEHGRFTSVDELGEVSGIGDKLLTQLRPKVSL